MACDVPSEPRLPLIPEPLETLDTSPRHPPARAVISGLKLDDRTVVFNRTWPATCSQSSDAPKSARSHREIGRSQLTRDGQTPFRISMATAVDCLRKPGRKGTLSASPLTIREGTHHGPAAHEDISGSPLRDSCTPPCLLSALTSRDVGNHPSKVPMGWTPSTKGAETRVASSWWNAHPTVCLPRPRRRVCRKG
ncbi:hypothetical protein VTI74DRAFT_9154 [Chaetomium olivicolor]